jgi:hypothetical protein
MSTKYTDTKHDEERLKATPPFGFTQGHESFDLAQDRELVERLVERPVEWQIMP